MEQDAKVKSLLRGPGAEEGTEAPRAHWLGSGLPRGHGDGDGQRDLTRGVRTGQRSTGSSKAGEASKQRAIRV